MSSASEGYQRVAALEDVPEGGCLAVELNGIPLVLIRRGDRIHALDNRCPHAGAPLSEGFVDGENITCSWHGWTFHVETGESVGEDSLVVPRHDVRVEDGQVLVRP